MVKLYILYASINNNNNNNILHSILQKDHSFENDEAK